MKQLLVVLALLLSCAVVSAEWEGPNWVPMPPTDNHQVDALAKSGAICERFGHNWKYANIVTEDYKFLDGRKCLICEKSQIRSMDWRDYEEPK